MIAFPLFLPWVGCRVWLWRGNQDSAERRDKTCGICTCSYLWAGPVEHLKSGPGTRLYEYTCMVCLEKTDGSSGNPYMSWGSGLPDVAAVWAFGAGIHPDAAPCALHSPGQVILDLLFFSILDLLSCFPPPRSRKKKPTAFFFSFLRGRKQKLTALARWLPGPLWWAESPQLLRDDTGGLRLNNPPPPTTPVSPLGPRATSFLFLLWIYFSFFPHIPLGTLRFNFITVASGTRELKIQYFWHSWNLIPQLQRHDWAFSEVTCMFNILYSLIKKYDSSV